MCLGIFVAQTAQACKMQCLQGNEQLSCKRHNSALLQGR